MKKYLLLIVMVLSLLAYPGCSKKKGSTTATDTDTTDDNPEVGVVDDTAGFYVRYRTSDNYTYDMHKSSAFGEDCIAEEGDDITCYLEGEEFDLYMNGVTLQYNVPSTLCSYLVFNAYYYYYYQPGTGPTAVIKQTDADGSSHIYIDADNDGAVDDEVTSLTCSYDYTASDGPNCCSGSYLLTTRVWNTDTGAYDVSAPETVPWGGAAANCLSGPAVNGAQPMPKSKNGFPRSVAYLVDGVGINKTYEIDSPASKDYASNVHVANYFKTADHPSPPHTTAGFYDAYVQPYYIFDCTDRAKESIARIRVVIREWNTEAEYDNRTDPTADPDAGGVETFPSAGPNNDFYDWKDFGTSYPQGNQ